MLYNEISGQLGPTEALTLINACPWGHPTVRELSN